MSRPTLKRAGVAGCLLLALAPAPDPRAQPVGRLFSTPEQRAALDGMRDDPGFGRETAPAAAATRPEPVADSGPDSVPEPASPPVTIDGIVLRGGVQRVSWINGVAVDAGAAAPGGIRIDAGRAPGGRFRVRLPDGRSTVDLKPGQRAGAVTGRVLEAYEHAPARDAAGGSSPSAAGRSGDGPTGGDGDPFVAGSASSPSAARRVDGGAAGEFAAAPATPVPSVATGASPATASNGPPGPATGTSGRRRPGAAAAGGGRSHRSTGRDAPGSASGP